MYRMVVGRHSRNATARQAPHGWELVPEGMSPEYRYPEKAPPFRSDLRDPPELVRPTHQERCCERLCTQIVSFFLKLPVFGSADLRR
jgi:hypothetical protein